MDYMAVVEATGVSWGQLQWQYPSEWLSLS